MLFADFTKSERRHRTDNRGIPGIRRVNLRPSIAGRQPAQVRGDIRSADRTYPPHRRKAG